MNNNAIASYCTPKKMKEKRIEDINFLKKGIYFVIIKTEEESIKEKIIVIK